MDEITTSKALEFVNYIKSMCCCALTVADTELKSIIYKDDSYCNSCRNAGCNKKDIFFYGCTQANRWGGRYIYYCPEGLFFTASEILSKEKNITGGIIAGPFEMSSEKDEDSDNVTTYNTSKARAVSEIIGAVASYISGPMIEWQTSQDALLKQLYSEELTAEYPIKEEKTLQNLIKSKDKQGSVALLNTLLAKIYLYNSYDLQKMKSSTVELITLMSRAAIDGGANSNDILWFTRDYKNKIDGFTKLDDISVYLSGLLNTFVNYSFDYDKIKHRDIIYKVMDYIKRNYNYKDKITLDSICKEVCLSRSYLSTVFKEETGRNITYYINLERIEQSKRYLSGTDLSISEVATAVGFDDQSYYTKVFRFFTGVTPKKFKYSCEL